ncbi:hypothetical protein BKA70DRAFT_1503151 [Coprinopsis sp. MPI-PUGE-AT-0042]|nr:hypothetical protein BKA70DRAFT_1503151 [Coprinopsis sp. MPI-PUGE-AT-0042]
MASTLFGLMILCLKGRHQHQHSTGTIASPPLPITPAETNNDVAAPLTRVYGENDTLTQELVQANRWNGEPNGKRAAGSEGVNRGQPLSKATVRLIRDIEDPLAHAEVAERSVRWMAMLGRRSKRQEGRTNFGTILRENMFGPPVRDFLGNAGQRSEAPPVMSNSRGVVSSQHALCRKYISMRNGKDQPGPAALLTQGFRENDTLRKELAQAKRRAEKAESLAQSLYAVADGGGWLPWGLGVQGGRSEDVTCFHVLGTFEEYSEESHGRVPAAYVACSRFDDRGHHPWTLPILLRSDREARITLLRLVSHIRNRISTSPAAHYTRHPTLRKVSPSRTPSRSTYKSLESSSASSMDVDEMLLRTTEQGASNRTALGTAPLQAQGSAVGVLVSDIKGRGIKIDAFTPSFHSRLPIESVSPDPSEINSVDFIIASAHEKAAKLEAYIKELSVKEDVDEITMDTAYEKLEEFDLAMFEAKATSVLHDDGKTDKRYEWWLEDACCACQIALCETHLLLLDEPINHLDLAGVLWFLWLEAYLSAYTHIHVITSHLQYFMDTTKAESEMNEMSAYHKQQEEIAHIKKQVKAEDYQQDESCYLAPQNCPGSDFTPLNDPQSVAWK